MLSFIINQAFLEKSRKSFSVFAFLTLSLFVLNCGGPDKETPSEKETLTDKAKQQLEKSSLNVIKKLKDKNTKIEQVVDEEGNVDDKKLGELPISDQEQIISDTDRENDIEAFKNLQLKLAGQSIENENDEMQNIDDIDISEMSSDNRKKLIANAEKLLAAQEPKAEEPKKEEEEIISLSDQINKMLNQEIYAILKSETINEHPLNNITADIDDKILHEILNELNNIASLRVKFIESINEYKKNDKNAKIKVGPSDEKELKDVDDAYLYTLTNEQLKNDVLEKIIKFNVNKQTPTESKNEIAEKLKESKYTILGNETVEVAKKSGDVKNSVALKNIDEKFDKAAFEVALLKLNNLCKERDTLIEKFDTYESESSIKDKKPIKLTDEGEDLSYEKIKGSLNTYTNEQLSKINELFQLQVSPPSDKSQLDATTPASVVKTIKTSSTEGEPKVVIQPKVQEPEYLAPKKWSELKIKSKDVAKGKFKGTLINITSTLKKIKNLDKKYVEEAFNKDDKIKGFFGNKYVTDPYGIAKDSGFNEKTTWKNIFDNFTKETLSKTPKLSKVKVTELSVNDIRQIKVNYKNDGKTPDISDKHAPSVIIIYNMLDDLYIKADRLQKEAKYKQETAINNTINEINETAKKIETLLNGFNVKIEEQDETLDYKKVQYSIKNKLNFSLNKDSIIAAANKSTISNREDYGDKRLINKLKDKENPLTEFKLIDDKKLDDTNKRIKKYILAKLNTASSHLLSTFINGGLQSKITIPIDPKPKPNKDKKTANKTAMLSEKTESFNIENTSVTIDSQLDNNSLINLLLYSKEKTKEVQLTKKTKTPATTSTEYLTPPLEIFKFEYVEFNINKTALKPTGIKNAELILKELKELNSFLADLKTNITGLFAVKK